jgi:hypothetical protein
MARASAWIYAKSLSLSVQKKGRPRPSFFAIDRCQTGSSHYRE